MYGVAVNCACFLELQETRVPNQGAGRTDPLPGYGGLIFLHSVSVSCGSQALFRLWLCFVLFCSTRMSPHPGPSASTLCLSCVPDHFLKRTNKQKFQKKLSPVLSRLLLSFSAWVTLALQPLLASSPSWLELKVVDICRRLSMQGYSHSFQDRALDSLQCFRGALRLYCVGPDPRAPPTNQMTVSEYRDSQPPIF